VTQPLTLVLATRNAGKAREFGRLLEGACRVEPLPPEVEMPEETGETFRGNALLKARGVFAALGEARAVLADDSGLEVSALDGRPGVRSARYAGETARDEENVAKLLDDLRLSTDRSACFICALCLVVPAASPSGAPLVLEVRGESAGTIEQVPRGDDGFGYDPVFRPQGWTETLAEAAPEKKDQVSHRGAAARALLRLIDERGVTARGQ
jgi:XTP/dITP diphosphohydrolase